MLELQNSTEGLLLMSGIAFQSFSRAFSNFDANSTSGFKEARVDFRQGTVLDCCGNAFLIYTYRIVAHPFLCRTYSSTLYFDILNQSLFKNFLHSLLRYCFTIFFLTFLTLGTHFFRWVIHRCWLQQFYDKVLNTLF